MSKNVRILERPRKLSERAENIMKKLSVTNPKNVLRQFHTVRRRLNVQDLCGRVATKKSLISKKKPQVKVAVYSQSLNVVTQKFYVM